jgi:hypothetical protein
MRENLTLAPDLPAGTEDFPALRAPGKVLHPPSALASKPVSDVRNRRLAALPLGFRAPMRSNREGGDAAGF